MDKISEHTKHLMDILSITTVIGTLAAILPSIAALLSIIWTALRLLEMWTGKTISEMRGKK